MNLSKITKILLYLKAVIWVGLAIFYFVSQSSPNPTVAFQVVTVLLLVNALAYMALGRLWSQKSYIYWITTAFITANIVLTITDQVGIIDIISLITDCGILILIIWSGKKSSQGKD